MGRNILPEGLIEFIMLPITSTKVYQFIYWTFDSLWSDVVGRIFLITVISYFIGFSVFGGYILRFSGGFSGLFLSRSGFQISDFVTFLPTMTLFTLDAIKNSFFPILRFVSKIFAYILTTFIVGASFGLIGIWLMTILNIQNLSLFIIQIGPLLYTCGFLFFMSVLIFPKYQLWLLVLSGSLQILGIGIIVVAITGGVQPEIMQSPEVEKILVTAYSIVYNVMTPLLIMALSLTPMLLGREMASFSIKEDLLSKVARISLRQPIKSMHICKITDSSPQQTNLWFENWLFRSNLPINIEPSVYEYDFTNSHAAYLIFSFGDTTGLYITNQADASDKGRFIVLSRELIYSLEFHSRRDS